MPEKSEGENNKLIMGLTLCGVSFMIMLMVILYASYKPESQAVLALEFKNGMKTCSSARSVSARSTDKVALLSPIDKSELEKYLDAQGTKVPLNSAILIMQESEQPEPVFVFVKANGDTRSVCVSGIIEALTLKSFYKYLLEVYFPEATKPSAVLREKPKTTED